MFNVSTRAFNVLTCAFNLATRAFSLLTHGFKLVTPGFELVSCEFELITGGRVYDTASELYNKLLVKYFMNAIIYQMQKEEKWTANVNLKTYFLKHIIMITSLKMKN